MLCTTAYTKNREKPSWRMRGTMFWTPKARSDHGGCSSWLSNEEKPIRISPDTTAEQWGDDRDHTMEKLEQKPSRRTRATFFGVLGDANSQI